MGIRNRASGQSQLSAGDLVTYAANGDVEKIVNAFDTTRPVVGSVVTDILGVVTYTDLLPAAVSMPVASGGAADAGKPAVVGGSDGYTNAPTLGSGSVAHFIVGIWAGQGTSGNVLMHPLPHWCTGGDVE